MKRILIAVMLVAAPAFAVEKAASKDEAAVRELFAQFFHCVAKKDMKCVAELCADDVTFISAIGEGKIVKGKAAFLKGFEELVSMGSQGTELSIKHTVQNVRLIDNNRALGDCSIESNEGAPPEAPAVDPSRNVWFTTAVVARKGKKWLFEDLRTYAVSHASPPAAAISPAPTPFSVAPAATQPPATAHPPTP